ncbi:MAG: hypothetical protein Q7S50_00280 [bacterium]|nr:hypothetical protein [bacterium]
MVVQKALNNLKEGSKDDKVAVAGGIAVSVVVVLLAAWAILFFRSVASGTQQINLSGGAQDEFNFSNVKDAQQKLQESYSNTADEIRQLRDDAAASQLQTEQQMNVQPIQGSGTDQFGGSGTVE